jgi:Bacterial RNA polymerase, alpha chain C terminal domain/Sigma-70, region 4
MMVAVRGSLSIEERDAYERSVLRRRWLNALERCGISTVGDLRAASEAQLLEIPMVGPRALADIAEALWDRSLCASDSTEMLRLESARSICERDVELVRMRQQGASLAMIARHFGISRERVRQILLRDGW